MRNRRAHRPLPAARPGRKLEDQGTRQQLLEAAGQVFAEKGFERATGKEICERAGTNTAAVNYYFGGMEGLYAAVLQEACSRLVPFEAAAAAVASKAEARDKLEAMLGLGIRTLLTGPAPSSWACGSSVVRSSLRRPPWICCARRSFCRRCAF